MYRNYLNRYSARNRSHVQPSNLYGRRRYRRHYTYSYPRRRPRASERDRRWWIRLYENRPRERRGDNITRNRREEPEEVDLVVPEEEVETKLHVKSIDYHIDENTKEHHTEEYECTDKEETKHPELVLRRGQEFKITIHFDRPYDIKKNDIRLSLKIDEEISTNQNLGATFLINETGEKPYKPKRWGATKVGQQGNSLTVSVFVPATVAIGEWELGVKTIVDVTDSEDDLIYEYEHNEELYIIFNPWCKDDLVYLNDSPWREETVLNDSGVIYTGTSRRIGVKPWRFAQFDFGILDASLELLRKGFNNKIGPGMASPIHVSRLASQMVNAPDDGGILIGNWSGEYDGGTAPTRWMGSDEIFEEYIESKLEKPVKFGQCWVFSGLTTTVCRSLGIPCRSVTNFSSAHNADAERLSIDHIRRFTHEGRSYNDSSDSVWNFHVWNEAWMARPDLSDKHQWDGWQAIDATPQEKSGEVFCCGPAPVAAVKEGEINVGFDTAFVFAEVNADRVRLEEDPKTDELVEVSRSPSSVGKKISTHRPEGAFTGASGNLRGLDDKMEREDLTDNYKYEEGSNKERTIVRKAEIQFRRNYGLIDDEAGYRVGNPQDVMLAIEEPGDVFIGNEVEFTVHVTNQSKNVRVLKETLLRVHYKTYFDSYLGVANVKKHFDTQLQPGQTETFKILLDKKRSLEEPKHGYNFEFETSVDYTGPDMQRTKSVEDILEYRLRKPDVEIKGPSVCSLKDTVSLDLSFTNPFEVTLTQCKLDLSGSFRWIDPDNKVFSIGDIAPGETWRKTIKVKPKSSPRNRKDRSFFVGFDSRQLMDVIGYHAIKIKEYN